MDPRSRKLLFYGLPPDPKRCPCYYPISSPDHPCDEPCPIFPPPPPPPPSSDLSFHKRFSLPIVLTVAIVVLATAFFFFTLYTVYRFYTCWRRSSYRRRRHASPGDGGVEEFLDEERGPIVDHPIWYIRTVGLDAAVIEAITVVRYKRGEGLIDGSDCTVCLSEFQDDETLRLLPKCNHAFHLPCIDTWLRSHTNCPLCRASIVSSPSPAAAAASSGDGHNTPVAAPTPADQNPEEIRIAVSELEPELNESEPSLCELRVRRSVSMDSISALAIYNAVQRQLEKLSMEEKGDLEAVKDGNNGGGKEIVIQTGQSSAVVKRSLSCSAKVFLSRHSQSRNSQV